MAYSDPSPHSSFALVAEPLSIAEEQAEILRVVTHATPGGGAVRIDRVSLENWELQLLQSDARTKGDVRDASFTVLRARAAELRLRRWLDDKTDRKVSSVEAASRLLDRILADLGSATDNPDCAHTPGLEDIARVLDNLYSQVSAESLRLAGTLGRAQADRLWLLDEVDERTFEIETPGAAAHSPVLDSSSAAGLEKSLGGFVDPDEEEPFELATLADAVALPFEAKEASPLAVVAAAAPLRPVVALPTVTPAPLMSERTPLAVARPVRREPSLPATSVGRAAAPAAQPLVSPAIPGAAVSPSGRSSSVVLGVALTAVGIVSVLAFMLLR